jgi:hypothetical protein
MRQAGCNLPSFSLATQLSPRNIAASREKKREQEEPYSAICFASGTLVLISIQFSF